jgi:sulfate transport system permease protein
MPGLKFSLGYTIFYLTLLVLVPLSSLFFRTASLSKNDWIEILSSERTLAAIKLSLSTSLISALINAALGFLIAWVLVRYTFPGKGMLDLLIDLPFALPTAVVGITLADLYAPNGWFGQYLDKIGIHAAYSELGMIIALMVIGLPFVIRTVEPVLKEIDAQTEEAATCLGATPWQVFRKVIFPPVFPALITGTTLSFARAIGEYGSVVFISGNMPFKTEVAPLLIMTKLEQFDYTGASAISVVMLGMSLVLFLSISLFQASRQKRIGNV